MNDRVVLEKDYIKIPTETKHLDIEISRLISEINGKREFLKETFIKAFFAVNMPLPKDAAMDWIINKVQLIEEFNPYLQKYTWRVELRK